MTIRVSAISNSEANLKVFSDATLVVGDAEFYPHIGSVEMLDSVLITDRPDVLVFDASVGTDLNVLQQLESALAKFPQIHTMLISSDQTVEYLTIAMHIGVRKVLPAPVNPLSFQEALRLAQSRMSAAAKAGGDRRGDVNRVPARVTERTLLFSVTRASRLRELRSDREVDFRSAPARGVERRGAPATTGTVS
jgi:DNA-binding NarL/FixJ family response regulator